MNIKGTELLRKLNLPAPLKEIILDDLSEIDLDYLYEGAKKGTTILAFDYTETMNQHPFLEKNVRKYKIEKNEYFNVLNELIDKLSLKGIKRENMKFLTHQTYWRDDVAFSGRIAISKDNNGFGELLIDAVESLRKANTDFNPMFIYRCPILGDRIFRSNEKVVKDDIKFPLKIMNKLIQDIYRIPGNPNVDFEVYLDNGELFYHDMFLANK